MTEDPAAKPPNRSANLLTRLLFAVLGVLFAAGALAMLIKPVNAVAYWLGYGEAIRVDVVETGHGGALGWSSEASVGRVVDSGVKVRLFGFTAGETVTARPQLIDVGVDAYVYTGSGPAASDLAFLIGFLVLGLPALIFLLAAYSLSARQDRVDD
jgi:hypothetical protein